MNFYIILESTINSLTRITRIRSSKCFVHRIPQRWRGSNSPPLTLIHSPSYSVGELERLRMCPVQKSCALTTLSLRHCFIFTFYLLPCPWQIRSPVTTKCFETVTSALYCEYTRLAAPPSSFPAQLSTHCWELMPQATWRGDGRANEQFFWGGDLAHFV